MMDVPDWKAAEYGHKLSVEAGTTRPTDPYHRIDGACACGAWDGEGYWETESKALRSDWADHVLKDILSKRLQWTS